MASKQKSVPATRSEALGTALATIEKQFGAGALMRLGERASQRVAAIPTGSLSLDVALGIGGVPRGRVIELFGAEASGKTTVALHIMASAQRLGGTCAIIDAEHALDPTYAQRLGLNIDELLISQPETGEQALEICDVLVRSGAVDVISVDSVAALTPKAEIEGEMGDQFVGLQARMMSQALRKLAGSLSRSNCVAIFINQLREKIGVMFGSPETTPGGRALKFYSSVRIKTRRTDTIKDGNTVVGGVHVAQVVKNKVAPPFREARFDIIYGSGISREGELLDMGLELGLIKKSGNWFGFGEERLGNGREAARRYLQEHDRLATTLETAIRAANELPPVASMMLDGSAPTVVLDEEPAPAALVGSPEAGDSDEPMEEE